MSDLTIKDGVLTKYIGEDTRVVIPQGVTHIGDTAFLWCETLTEIIIPESVISIGDYAFECCRSLTKIVIPDGVVSIGGGAFNWCEALSEIFIPGSVVSIGHDPFIGTAIKSIEVDPNNPVYKTVGGDLYAKDTDPLTKNGDKLIAYAYGKTDAEFVIPNGVGSIASGAFTRNTSLTRIVTPDSLEIIEEKGFFNCDALKTVVLSEGVKSIDNGAFRNCKQLTEINIPDSVITISNNAFYACPALERIFVSVDKLDLLNMQDENVCYAAIMGCITLCANGKFTKEQEERLAERVKTHLDELSERIANDATAVSFITTHGIPSAEDAVTLLENCTSAECRAILLEYIYQNKKNRDRYLEKYDL